MFRTDDPARLRAQLDHFNVPMFIVQPSAQGDDFKLLALNASHEAKTGLQMRDVIGRPLAEILPPAQARDVKERYSTCITRTPEMRYREKLVMPGGEMIWDTTLHHFLSHRGVDRIVGSAVVVEYVQRDDRDTLAFEDVRYFASSSQFNLRHMASVLEAVEQGTIPPERLAGSAAMLAGLCRAIDVTMQELRSIAEGRLDARLNPEKPLIASSEDRTSLCQTEVETAMAALIDAANCVPQYPRESVSSGADAPDTKAAKHFEQFANMTR